MNFLDDITESNSNNWLVVDALNLAFRYKHRQHKHEKYDEADNILLGEEFNAVKSNALDFTDDYIRTINSLARSYNCGTIAIVCDYGASDYRKAILPTYKSARKEKHENASEEDKLAAEAFFAGFQNCLEALKNRFPVFRYRGVEADDLAAYICKNKNKLNINEITLVSSDKDWNLLIAKDISRFCYVTRKDITIDSWSELNDVSLEEYISQKCLMGDSGDSVPGIDGIGPKRAKDLIDKYGSAFDIYDALPIDGKAQYIKNLNNSGERLLDNYRLMDLLSYCEEAIGDHLEDFKRDLGNINAS